MQAASTTFRVYSINPQRARWLWLLVVAVVAGLLLNTLLVAQLSQPLPGILLGAGLALGLAVGFGRWILVAATVQASATQLLLVPAETGAGQETLPLSHIAYGTYTTYRAPLLQLYRADGTRLRLRARGGAADLDALAQLLQSRLGSNRFRRW